MKRKGLYVLATVAMLALVAGCGSNQGEENPQNQVTEAVSPKETPEATATSEPTATPAPTATPVPANYMEANGIEVLGAGNYTCKGYVAQEWDENGVVEIALADCEYLFEVTEEDNGNGTKTIYAALSQIPHIAENGGWSTYIMGGFVDLQTGKSFVPMNRDVAQITMLKQEDKEYELQLAVECATTSVTYPYYTEKYTLVCPSDYEDAGFYITSCDFNADYEAYGERIGLWKKLNFIRHGEAELLVCGVNEGLATEYKRPVDGAELAEENYFETNGFTAKGEGTYTWLGMEATRRWNEEAGYWESVSLEEKEFTTTISIAEESLGDGTKQITWNVIELCEQISEVEVKIPYKLCCIADRKTGLVYPPRNYNLAESYVLEKDGEEISILVGMEIAEEALGDGKIESRTTFTLICPEDYNDAVFYLTADVEIDDDEHTYFNEREVFSLNELEHGDYELMFFQ